jgi:hypothetical protein
MPSARERLAILNHQIELARLAIDERRSLVRLMEQQAEDTDEVRRLLTQLQSTLDDMIQLRTEIRRQLERTGG